jgi:hypothetical protein
MPMTCVDWHGLSRRRRLADASCCTPTSLPLRFAMIRAALARCTSACVDELPFAVRSWGSSRKRGRERVHFCSYAANHELSVTYQEARSRSVAAQPISRHDQQMIVSLRRIRADRPQWPHGALAGQRSNDRFRLRPRHRSSKSERRRVRSARSNSKILVRRRLFGSATRDRLTPAPLPGNLECPA